MDSEDFMKSAVGISTVVISIGLSIALKEHGLPWANGGLVKYLKAENVALKAELTKLKNHRKD